MKKTTILSLFILLPLAGANAQQIASGRLVSLGGLSTAISTDVDAIGTNPANLMARSQGTVVVELIPFTINAGSDFLSTNLYNDYFTGTGQVDSAGNKIGTYLTQSDKQKILDAFPGGVGSLRFNTSIRTLAVSVRNPDFAIGFAVDDWAGAKVTIPNSLLFPLNGNAPGSTISLNDIASDSWWYRTYSADYAMELSKILIIPKEIVENLEVGVGLKYVTGFSYTSIQSVNSSLYTSPTDYSYTVNMGFNAVRAGLLSNAISKGVKSTVGDTVVNFNPFAPQGSGFGFDLGASGRILTFVKVGISLTDIGSISWNKNVVTTSGDTSFTYSGFSPAQANEPGSKSNLDSLKDAFNNYFKNKDALGSSISTPLPTRLNVGAMVQLDQLLPGVPGPLMVAVDYHQGFNNSMYNTTKPQVVLGTEWNPVGVLPLRTALSFGGMYGFRWSLGLGLDLPSWDFDLGIGTFNDIVAPMDAKNVSVVLNILKFRF